MRRLFLLLFSAAAWGETVTKTVTIGRTPGPVFDYITTAMHWPRWHPATLGVSGDIAKPMKPGDRIRETARIGGAVGTGEWTVTGVEPGRSVTLSLPGTRLGDLTIRYRFAETAGGVEFRRELTFDLSALPPQLDRDRIRQQMDRDSELALQNLKRLIEESPAQ